MALLLLAGCAVPQAEVSPEGVLEVITPAMAQASDGSDGDWIALLDDGDRISPDQLSITMPQGTPVARAVAGKHPYRVVRRVRVNLLASPYLSWQWRISRHREAVHPVRLLIGFYGGDARFGSRGGQPFAFLGRKLPAHDRTLEIVWAAQALARGALVASPGKARYTARGGIDNTERWWSETLDLEALYRRLWPRDEINRVQVTFIGIAAEKAAEIELAEFKELALHR